MAIVRMSKQRRELNRKLGLRLAALRRRRGLTQVDLAEILGVGQSLVSHYERGQTNMDAFTLVKTIEALDVSADELLRFSDAEPATGSPPRRFLRRLRLIDRLSEREQKALLQTLDAFLEREQLKKKAS